MIPRRGWIVVFGAVVVLMTIATAQNRHASAGK
jgi:hypothetical protein